MEILAILGVALRDIQETAARETTLSSTLYLLLSFFF